jgi:hypothetical protein
MRTSPQLASPVRSVLLSKLIKACADIVLPAEYHHPRRTLPITVGFPPESSHKSYLSSYGKAFYERADGKCSHTMRQPRTGFFR